MVLTEENYKSILNDNGRILNSKSIGCELPKNKWFNSIKEAVYCYKNVIQKKPKCHCGKPVNFNGTNKGYQKNCSITCARTRTTLSEDAKELKITDVILSKTGKVSVSAKLKYTIPKHLTWVKTLKEAMHCLKNNIVAQPICEVCDNPVKFSIDGFGKYYNTCSTNCSNKSETTKLNKEVSLLSKYGVKNASQVIMGLSTTRKYDPARYTMWGKLYIFKSDSKNIIKIGVSSNPENRLKAIKKYMKDAKIIHQSCFISNVYMYEDFLHKKFYKYNKQQPEGCGRKEWFCESVTDEVLKDIHSITDIGI